MKLRLRVVILAVSILIPICVLMVYSTWHDRQIATQAVNDEAVRLARLVVLYHEKTVQSTHQLLVALAQLPGMERGSSESRDLLEDLIDRYPEYLNFGVIDAHGRLICSALPAPKNLDLSDRRYFRDAVEQQAFSVGEYQIGRVTGKPSINFAYPIHRDGGKFRGIVFAAVDAKWFESLGQGINLPAGGSAFLLDRNGMIVSRYPKVEPTPPSEFFPALASLNAQQGNFMAEINGKKYLFGYAMGRVQAVPLAVYTAIGIQEQVAYRAIKRSFYRNILVVFGIALLAIAWAFLDTNRFIYKPVLKLMAATDAVSRGDFSFRTGLSKEKGELGRLGVAFDRMAASLERQGVIKHFFSPQIAELLFSENKQKEITTIHRKEITILFTDLRGFTAFSGLAKPEQITKVLEQYFGAIGAKVMEFNGTIGGTFGDGMLIFLNDPVEIPDHPYQGVRLALEIRKSLNLICRDWKDSGIELSFGIGMVAGEATIGPIGFDRYWNYSPVGTSVNLAWRICAEATGEKILVPEEFAALVKDRVQTAPSGEFMLKGFSKPVRVHEVVGLA